MSNPITVGVAVENTAYHFDQLYEYAVPPSMVDLAVPGVRVIVPFGKGNSTKQGVILQKNDCSSAKKLKKIIEIKDNSPIVSGDLLKLVFWLRDRTFCTYFDAFQCILPAGINLKLTYFYGADPDYESELLPNDEKEIYLNLLKTCKYIEKDKLLSAFGFQKSSNILERMYKKGALIRNVDSKQLLADKTERVITMAISAEDYDRLESSLSKKQKSVCDLLFQTGGASTKEICYYLGITSSVIKTLEKKGVIQSLDNEVYRNPISMLSSTGDNNLELTDEQQTAYDNLVSQFQKGEKLTSLLYGITGSGKTQVYIKLIDYMLSIGKGAIMMVPEISLTPQILQRFYNHFGSKIAVFHSALSLGERLDEWKRVQRGEAKVVIGTRSAVFAPVENLGVIIVDEEQEHTYKSEQTPRYNAKEVARFRCAENKALLLLGSATPSIEAFAKAQKGIYTLNTLTKRYAGATLPQVITVDISADRGGAISGELAQAIQNTVSSGQQAILLMNRRGYNTFASCKACGKVVSCPNCSISLTYHHANGRLMCHYCGYSQPLTDCCSECGMREIRYAGCGTQMVEEELAELFPNVKILRMDQDTTMRKNSHEKALSAFAKKEYDILLGTQMVAKGIDFENVTLVGVISVDQQLYNDDYRSLERTFSLLTQVVGRAGRGSQSGKAIIQTTTPDNEIIQLAAKQDYLGFFKTEIALRKIMTYPPYCDLCVIGFSSEDENKVRAVSKLFFARFKALASGDYANQKLIVLGPLQPRISKISNKYRWRMIIKCKNNPEFRSLVSRLLVEFGKDSKFNDVSIFADMNPESLM